MSRRVASRTSLAKRATDHLTASIVRQWLRGRRLAYCPRCLAAGIKWPDLKPIRAAVLTIRQRPGFRLDRCLCGAVGVKYAGAANNLVRGDRTPADLARPAPVERAPMLPRRPVDRGRAARLAQLTAPLELVQARPRWPRHRQGTVRPPRGVQRSRSRRGSPRAHPARGQRGTRQN